MKTRNKRIILTIIGVLSLQSLIAQIPVPEWVQQIGGESNEEARSMAVDTFGNIYITGQFYGTTDFDPGEGEFNLTCTGAIDIFVQKLDVNGNFLWAKQMGGSDFDNSLSIAVDASGNVFTTGYFQGKVDFDPGSDVFNLTCAGTTDIFVQKLDTNGDFIWAKQMGGANNDSGYSLVTDAVGNVYITGIFDGTADFDPSAEIAYLTSAGHYDIFVQKLDSNGNFIWAKQIGGNEWDQGNAIAIDNSQNIYITGYFIGTADFDPGVGTENLTSAGDQDIFVLKLDTNGDFIWAEQMGGTDGDAGQSIAVDKDGNVNLTGYFREIADFDPGEGTVNLGSTGSAAIFVQKLDTSGNFLWAKQMGGAVFFWYSIAVDTSGNIYTFGNFEGTTDFDPGAGESNLTSGGSYDVFIQKLDANGEFIWVNHLGENKVAWSLAVDATGNIYTTGSFGSTSDFDPYEGKINLSSAGLSDIYVQKLYPCFPTNPVPDLTDLPELSAMCVITDTDAPTPTATSNCVGTVTASSDVTFPITDQSITQIVWTYDDRYGNAVTQNQTINWIPVDVTTSLNGDTITANNGNGIYRWLNCNKNYALLYGENDQSFIVKANGNYAVEITENGCVDTSACISVIKSGLIEFEPFEMLVVYPNPSSENFKIEFGKVLKNAVLEVKDIRGKLVSTIQIQNSAEASIKLKETPGIYLLTIKSKEYLKTIQLIKK